MSLTGRPTRRAATAARIVWGDMAPRRRLYSQVAPLLTGIEDAVSVTSGSSVAVRGPLRVNVDAFFSSLLFTPHISEFLSLYPDLSLELVEHFIQQGALDSLRCTRLAVCFPPRFAPLSTLLSCGSSRPMGRPPPRARGQGL